MHRGSGSGARTALAVAEQPLAVTTVDRRKPVLITGAAGLVGTHTCRELVHRGWKIRALVRTPGKAAARLGQYPLELRVGDLRDADVVAAALEGVGAIVHLAAIAIERLGESYESINTEVTRSLLHAARRAGVPRFIHVSQNGASSTSPFRFLRSKGIAEDLVVASDRQWTVLRPSVIFGREDAFTMLIARLARLTPFVLPLPDGGRARFQPISADDVARVIALVLERPKTVHGRYALGGVTPLSLRQMSERILVAMSASRRIIAVPIALLRPLIAIAERLLPRPPVTTSLLQLLRIDNVVPENALNEVFGIIPAPFAAEELNYLRGTTTRGAIAWMLGR